MTWSGWTWFVLGFLVVVLGTGILVTATLMVWERERETQPASEAGNNLRHIALSMNDRARACGRWPLYGGRNFLLSLVADGTLDTDRHANLRVLYRFGGFVTAPPQEAWREVTAESFASGRVRFLTREDLGLGPDDPIVVGDRSRSALLRKLSDR